MVEIWVPIGFFVSIATIVGLVLYFGHKTKHEVQETIRAALEKGQELSPELLDKLGHALPSPKSDLRRGVMAVTLGLALIAFGYLLGEEGAQEKLMAIAAFPFFIGVAYLGLHKFGK
ncbi:MAG: DUF6249 domain-containing protein [Gammaproteobacteria bacterium]|nr:DUF6249 domain-containing protein [Gammaproteobacteria bacterium]MCZ6826464.1 DUF6249 domain-containing protein [Gammaproteobacteria bacterium]MCZ6912904.1 DUF6249 domain-containing protein [Pseudomonadota bacterium]